MEPRAAADVDKDDCCWDGTRDPVDGAGGGRGRLGVRLLHGCSAGRKAATRRLNARAKYIVM